MDNSPRAFAPRHAPARVAATCGLVLSIAALLPLAGGCERPQAAAAPPPADVTVSQPIEREVVEWDEYTGRLEASETVEVRARVSGLIDSAPFVDGARVKKGDVLFVIDPRPFQAELDRAQSDVIRAEAQVQQTTDELARIESLRPGGAASVKEFLDARYNKRSADAALAAARANARTAELNLEWTKVTAPIDGRLSRRLVTPGNLVNGGAGQATLLTTITRYDPIYCYVDADEPAILKYQRLEREHRRVSARSTPIPAFLGLSDEEGFPHEGKVDFVENRFQPGTGTLQARATFANPDARFTPGMFARMRVSGSGRYRALLVADQAIQADQGLRYVYVVTAENKAESRPVTPGALFEGLRVVEGIRPDDWVVVNGFQRIRPGGVVAPQRAPMPFRSKAAGSQIDLTRQVPPAPATQPTTAPTTAPATQPLALAPAPSAPAAAPPTTTPTSGGGVAR